MVRTTLALCAVLFAFTSAASIPSLPEGNNGIAARYPSDAGIAADPEVIFADDFESYSSAAGLTAKWTDAYHTANIRIATEPGNVLGGAKSLEFTIPQTTSEVSNTVAKRVSPERDVLFLRYYAKFDGAFDVVGSSHNGSDLGALLLPGRPAPTARTSFWSTTKPGATGRHRESRQAERLRLPSRAARDQWGDHFFPTGIVLPNSSTPFDFGPDFVARPDVIPVLGRWYCYEFMVKANTPGQRDGRIAFWLDGQADRRLSQPAAARDVGTEDRPLLDRPPRIQQLAGDRSEVVRTTSSSPVRTSARSSPVRCRERPLDSRSSADRRIRIVA